MKKIKQCFLCTVLCISMLGCTRNNIRTKDTDNSTEKEVQVDYHTYEYNGTACRYNSHLINFLITGIDNRDGNGGQSDFILLLSFDREHKEYRILQLDRSAVVDIRVYDAEHNYLGWSPSYLALSYSYGRDTKQGTLYVKDAVSRLLHEIPIGYYTTITLDDLGMIQDVVGPMDVEVKDTLLAEINPEWTQGSIVTVTRDNVEEFIRYRNTDIEGSNEMRMERQKEYLNTYLCALQTLIHNDFSTAVERVGNVADSVYTNVQLLEVRDMLQMITDFTFDDIYQLPGKISMGTFRTQFDVDMDTLQEMIIDLYYISE